MDYFIFESNRLNECFLRQKKAQIFTCQNFYSAKLKLRNLSTNGKNIQKEKKKEKIPAVSVRAAAVLPCDAFLSCEVTSCCILIYLKRLPVMWAATGTGSLFLP